MEVKYKRHMKELLELAGKIGRLGSKDPRYIDVYDDLAVALDTEELNGLIIIEEEEYE